MQMLEALIREPPHSMLSDPGKQDVADLSRHHHHHPRHAIGDDQHDRHEGQGGDDIAAVGRRQPVDRMLIGEGRGNRDELGQHQHDAGKRHAQTKVRPVPWPHERKKRAQNGEVVFAVGRVGR
jgi:hypothetical protein